MAHPSTSSSLSEDIMYQSKIISSEHGIQYQKNLALLMFARATRKRYDFQLAYEMELADKFDDVAFFNKDKAEWTLIQAKHVSTHNQNEIPFEETSDGKRRKLSPSQQVRFDMMFPPKHGKREKNDFDMHKYLKSYMTVRANFYCRTKVVIFTNRELEENLPRSIKIESRQVNKILHLGQGDHVGLNVEDSNLFDQIIDYVNQDFKSLVQSVVDLFNKKIVNNIIKDFKIPVASVLTKVNNNVKFSRFCPPEAREFLESLKKNNQIDIETAQIPLDKCKDIFTGHGKSKIKTFPHLAKKETLKQFLSDLTLCVGQPDDLQVILDQDMHSWVRTWVRPDHFARLEESQLKLATTLLKDFFEKQQSTVKHMDGSSRKQMLLPSDGEKFFETTKQVLEKHFPFPSNINDASKYYINRQIEHLEHLDDTSDETSERKERKVKMKTPDRNFITALTGKFEENQFYFLTAESGMGKSTVFQYIAFAVQRETSDCVYLFYLDTLNEELDKVTMTDTDDKLLAVLSTALSKANFNSLLKTIKEKDNNARYLLLFDAFDEVAPVHSEKILKIFSLLQGLPNVSILVSGLNTVQTLAEKTFKVQTLSLAPFSHEDQISFLQKIWEVSEENQSRFQEFVEHLFEATLSGVNQALCEFVGIPLIMKMLAKVYDDHRKEYLLSGVRTTEDLVSQETLSLISLYGASVCGKGYPPLHLAAIKTYLKVVQIMIDYHGNVNAKDRYGLTPLHHSARYGELEVVKFLVEHAADVNTKDGAGWTPLLFAAESGHLEVVKLLTEYKADVNVELTNGRTPIIFATDNKHLEVVQFLLQHSANVNAKDDDGWTPLHIAARNGRFETAKLLVEHFADVMAESKYGCTPLYLATRNGSLKVVKLLTEYSSAMDTKIETGETLLIIAAKLGHLQVVQFLAEHIDVNARCKNGRTAVHYAAVNGHLEVVRFLAGRSACLKAKDKDKRTPLHYAAEDGHPEVVRFLATNCTTDVNAQQSEGWTPLHGAVKNGHLEVVNILTEHFAADVNAKNAKGYTPLDLAADFKRLAVVNFLTEKINLNNK